MSVLEQSIVYPIEKPPISWDIQRQAEIDGYQLKDEFHITIASVAYLQSLSESQQETFAALLKAAPAPQISYDEKLYGVTHPKRYEGRIYERDSLVALVKPSTVVRWLGAVTAQAKIPSPTLLPHVTLFTRPDNRFARRGIGVDSVEEWIALDPWVYADWWQDA